MRIKFNDSNLIVGYIKELLHEFNLPSIKVYTEDTTLYKDRVYIKNDKFVRYDGTKFIDIDNFYYNKPIQNITRNFIINSSIYDSYTHTYLGDYLRFIRDYKGVNLMPIYNCFNKEEPKYLNATFQVQENSSEVVFDIDTTDINYNYYIVPIKFDQQYTISIDARTSYELATIIYTDSEVTDMTRDLVKRSYIKVPGSSYTNLVLYDTHFGVDNYWTFEDNLKLLIKLPKRIKSSITILEGDYTNYVNNYNIISDVKGFDSAVNKQPITRLSLLDYGGEESIPFSNRLIEYLLNSAITPMETIENNIYRIQEKLYKGKVFKGYKDIWDNQIKDGLYNIANNYNTKATFFKLRDIEVSDKSGEFIYIDKPYIKFSEETPDLLYYVDKDIESLLEVYNG